MQVQAGSCRIGNEGREYSVPGSGKRAAVGDGGQRRRQGRGGTEKKESEHEKANGFDDTGRIWAERELRA